MSISDFSKEHIEENESDVSEHKLPSLQDNCKEEPVIKENKQCNSQDTHLETNISVDNKSCNLVSTSELDKSVSNDLIFNKDLSHCSITSLDKLSFDNDVCNEKIRRNSLPENSLKDIVKNSSSDDLLLQANIDSARVPTLSLDRMKVTPNITGVVKNVHGLFSSLKNVYKDKHIGDMLQATQKNLTSAKNGYLNMKQEMFNDHKQTSTQKEILETIHKYSNLNLSSEAHEIEKIKKDNIACLKENESEDVKTMESNVVECEESRGTDEESSTNLEVIAEQNKQIDNLKDLLMEKDKRNKDIESKYLEISKQLEMTVMRYVMSEKQILSMEKTRNAAVEKEAKAQEEVLTLERKLKSAHLERTRICDMLDSKSYEVISGQKEINKLKEELSAMETKLKWSQNKLMSEIEAHKEASLLAEKLGQQIQQGETSSHQPENCASQSSNHSSTTTLTDAQVKELEAATILERHERQRQEEKCKTLQKEIDQLKLSVKNLTQMLGEQKAQAESSAGEADALRDVCNELRIQAAKDCERLAATQAKAVRLDTVTGLLQLEQEKNAKLLCEIEAEKKCRSTAQAEAELSMRREAELLRQTERLTEAGVRLQAFCSEAEAKALALSVDNASLRLCAEREAEKVALAKSEAESEKRGREGDAKALAGAAARHQRAERLALQKIEQLEGDLRIMATKHASTVKELKREIQQWKRKCEKMEKESFSHNHVNNVEKNGSCSSLSSFEGASNHPPEENVVDRQHLVEKIVELQRAAARRNERMDFLEGHSAQLTSELQKKSKLLRNMLSSMPAGALAAAASDRAKVEMGRHGGIMASLFTNEVADDGMNIDLALEITAKLQAVLEDTLLKNITLKENMDTLGDEIALLKEELKKRPKK